MILATSDWITIVFSLIAVLIGAGVSWLFFRAQLRMDLQGLRVELRSTSESIRAVEAQLKFDAKLDTRDDIQSIRQAVERIENDLKDSVASQIDAVGRRTEELAKQISQEFETQSRDARDAVGTKFAEELSSAIHARSDRDRVLDRLLDLFTDAMRSMGQYQRESIEQHVKSSFEGLREEMSRSIDEVLGQVAGLREAVDELPLSLTGPPNEAIKTDGLSSPAGRRHR